MSSQPPRKTAPGGLTSAPPTPCEVSSAIAACGPPGHYEATEPRFPLLNSQSNARAIRGRLHQRGKGPRWLKGV